MEDDEILRFDDPEQLHAWLEENQDTSDGVWLLLAKKGAPFTTVSYPEVV
jgi:hypothetical protein